MGTYGNQFAQPLALAKFRRTHRTFLAHIKSATETLHVTEQAKTTRPPMPPPRVLFDLTRLHPYVAPAYKIPKHATS
jgi:hypothetical protein